MFFDLTKKKIPVDKMKLYVLSVDAFGECALDRTIFKASKKPLNHSSMYLFQKNWNKAQ